MRSDYVAIPWEGSCHPRPPGPHGLRLRGFGIYVGLDAGAADAAGVDLATVVGEVRRAITGIPGAETFTSVVLAPPDAPEPPLAVVRTALGEPSLQRHSPRAPQTAGVVVDLARHRVTVDGRPVGLSFREHALLTFLVEHQGEVHDRQRLLTALLGETDGDPIGERTIDVYLQRLRRRLAPYGEVVRTVRGHGYRLDPHPDVTVVPAVPAR
ncbi:MAG: winged helix-turn-helix domain-containing protein [Protaetiibacter sp.]